MGDLYPAIWGSLTWLWYNRLARLGDRAYGLSELCHHLPGVPVASASPPYSALTPADHGRLASWAGWLASISAAHSGWCKSPGSRSASSAGPGRLPAMPTLQSVMVMRRDATRRNRRQKQCLVDLFCTSSLIWVAKEKKEGSQKKKKANCHLGSAASSMISHGHRNMAC